MTTDIVVIYQDKEIMLEVEATKGYPQTRHSPEEPAEFEIISAHDRDGEVLDDEAIEWITNHQEQDVWDALERLAEYSHDDYLLEKRAEEARERYLEARYKN